ncbi:hypothetical protein COU18_01025 [Candidatus Kaiserbacteria bacterium CG10_big_fil_rev_8_21_14_0_10_51_14]|uniref:VIT family protein n=1 Tax=Candidatus Kaiserbacteria bacterium CG10_big_fil_rev_8_21_14_0_10_51_14 TaxID=1974610 RepID=A0A2H0UDW1_9BACT|nr:MAG: hypothetical protein COU18_01025 [Candidatus Kaiserbacteria bacterium CG10_big_fil_rev_8_21_14_0_10_51_14]
MRSRFKKILEHYIGDIVYGANDGIITTFAVIAGAAGAGLSSSIVIVLGIANLVADGFSMGASKYLSTRSEQSLEEARNAHRSALADGTATFIAFVVAGTLPLIPFFYENSVQHTFWISSIATGIAFFLIGAARSLVIKKHFVIAGLEMLIVGGVAASMAYGIGYYIQTLVTTL